MVNVDAANLAAFHATRDLRHQSFRSACYAPFVGMSFGVSGAVSVCSFTRATPLGHVGEQPLIDMWRGHVAGALRRMVAADRLEGACSRCAEEIQGGNFHGVLAAGFDRFTADPALAWPRRMEFALSNLCNLQCVMCSGEYSSAIRSQREGLPPIRARYGDGFFEELTPFLPHLEQARFLGGEPFLAPENFRIWELMAETGSSADCNVTTNGTVWNSKVEAVLDQLPFSIGVSIDGATRETVESIRCGASFDRIMRNLERFLAYRERQGSSLSLTFSLMVGNWREFGDFLKFAEGIGCQVYVNTVRQPPRHSLFRLPASQMREVVEELEASRGAVSESLNLNRALWNEQLDNLAAHLDALEGCGTSETRFRAVSAPLNAAGLPVDSLVETLARQSETEAISALELHAGVGAVSVLRYDSDGVLVQGDPVLDEPVNDLFGRHESHLFTWLTERLGNDTEVIAESVTAGSIARIVAFGGSGRRVTQVAILIRSGAASSGFSRLVAVLGSNSVASV